MLLSDIITALKDLSTLIGLPFFTVLMGFFVLAVELFGLGVLMLFVVCRIRKEMINMNRKIDLLVQLPEEEGEKEAEKRPDKESQKESEEELEKELGKKKFRYKWK
jgi:hypothetical protein